MIAFEVYCNDNFLYRMGIPEKQRVLSLSLTKAPQQDQVSLIAIGNAQPKEAFPSEPSNVDNTPNHNLNRFMEILDGSYSTLF